MKLRSNICLHVWLCLGVGLLCAKDPYAADGAAAGAAVALTDVQILKHARAANRDIYSSLQSFVCNEKIHRFDGGLDGQPGIALDTVTARLSFERGVEQYTNVFQDNRPRAGMSSLSGAWSEGEFGTLLLQTELLLTTQKAEFDDFTDVQGEHAAIYHFDVSSEASPWDLAVSGHHFQPAFRTTVWISVNTGEILKIDRVTKGLAKGTHIAEIQWGITLDHVVLNGKVWLLPTSGTYAVLYSESRHKEWNSISFSGYQRYGAQTAVEFQ